MTVAYGSDWGKWGPIEYRPSPRVMSAMAQSVALAKMILSRIVR